MKWLFHNPARDFMVLYLPALITLFLVHCFQVGTLPFALLVFFVLYAVDAGHTYVTGWRVLTKSSTHDHFKATASLLAFWFGGTALIFLHTVLFWHLVVYFTLYHHIRQFYGITAWYQRLNGQYVRSSAWFVHLLCALPILALHFRPDFDRFPIYTDNDMFLHPGPELFRLVVTLNVFVFLAWLITEFILVEKDRAGNSTQWNRISSILIPTFFQSVCIYFGSTVSAILFPLLVLHGSAYLALMSTSMHKVRWPKLTVSKVALVMCATALVGGSLLAMCADLFHMPEELSDLTTVQKFVAAFLVTPALWHYWVDGWIWRSRHPEAARIYAQA